MRKFIAFIGIAGIVLFGRAAAGASYTLTFDDVPSGTALWYCNAYRYDRGATFDMGFHTADHAACPWAVAQSDPNVLLWTGNPYDQFARLIFGRYTTSSASPYWVEFTSAYFSTQVDTVVRLTAYDGNDAVGSVLIGSPDEAWDRKRVEIRGTRPFYSIDFEGVSGAGLCGFCLDDLAVTPVPEPSSLLAFFAGAGGSAALVLKRRLRARGHV